MSEQVTDKKLFQEQKKDDLSIEFATPVVHEKTIDINLPKIERRVNTDTDKKVDINEVNLSTPKLAVDTFMKPTVSRIEEKDLELIVNQPTKHESILKSNKLELSLDQDITASKIDQTKPSLDKEFFSLKSKGYVDTILDKLMNLLATLLKKLDNLIFKGSSRFSNKKALKAKRAAELEEFMNERYKEIQNKKAMQKAKEDTYERKSEVKSGLKSDSTAESKNSRLKQPGFTLDQNWEEDN